MPARALFAAALVLAACGDPTPEPDPAPAAEVVRAVDLTVPDGVEVPAHMAYVPGGTTRVGILPGEAGMPHERPAFEAVVAPFLLDRSPVTVARFRAFVDATDYQTQAEAFGDGAVMDQTAGAWALVPGVDWRRPRGPGTPEAPDDHPVTQVSWTDASAFCEWDGGRLPTEPEWEHAARGARDDRRAYAWGDALVVDGRPGANTWTGSFPGGDDGADGFRDGTSPVGAFGATALGLTDLGGNVWEWTAGWYRPYPLGPDGGTAPGAPVGATGEPERAQRGGSFLCHPSYCHGYRVSARSHATPESSFAHVGFRCARDL
ncbi:formylglycine-generating enzyme family protein [Rubrivirga sp. IMCC45206]|uniref:formylglycine-generating enzyme family protein n=1 Tax=Rubrivirga sp. IMCC45206 TaxID=3391614 RepID=UPI003990024B